MDENNVNKEQETAAADAEALERGDGVHSDAVTDTDTAQKSGTEQGAESANDSSFSDSRDSGEEKDPSANENKQGHQTKEQNAENARRRREAERQKELRDMREKTIIETLGGKNPYTGEAMTDSLDVEEYETMREIEKNGGDPVNDYPKFRKQKDRESFAQQEKKEESEEWYRKDNEAFRAAYPDVDLSALVQNEDFRDYADGKVGRKPLSEIYQGFLKFTGKYQDRAKDMAAQYIANQQASPGALHDTGTPDSDFFTFEQVQKMSQEEVHKNYDNIIKSQRKWK